MCHARIGTSTESKRSAGATRRPEVLQASIVTPVEPCDNSLLTKTRQGAQTSQTCRTVHVVTIRARRNVTRDTVAAWPSRIMGLKRGGAKW